MDNDQNFMKINEMCIEHKVLQEK